MTLAAFSDNNGNCYSNIALFTVYTYLCTKNINTILVGWTSTLCSREQGGHHEGRSGSVAAALHHAGGELPGH